MEVRISISSRGLETANCSAALVMYETTKVVGDEVSNTGHGWKGGEHR